MKQNVKMAKVITLKTQVSSDRMILVVTTVDPIVTPEMAKVMYGIPGRIIKREETNIMPLPFALNFACRQRAKLGITNCVTFAN